MAACGRDVAAAVRGLDVAVNAVVGHSFGGKVAVELLKSRLLPRQPALGVVLDSALGTWDALADADKESAARILLEVRTLGTQNITRRGVAEHFESLGFSKALQSWASSAIRAQNGKNYEWTFDHETVGDLLRSCVGWALVLSGDLALA